MSLGHTIVGRRAVARRSPDPWRVLRWFTLLPAAARQARPVVLLGPDTPFWTIPR